MLVSPLGRDGRGGLFVLVSPLGRDGRGEFFVLVSPLGREGLGLAVGLGLGLAVGLGLGLAVGLGRGSDFADHKPLGGKTNMATNAAIKARVFMVEPIRHGHAGQMAV